MADRIKIKSRKRQIRVFISSTFRDMKKERDELVKYVFPELRMICEDRHVVWGEVDLRWGVTDEQAAEGKVLPVCLEEIMRCRPYFIGLLGERYGWVPDHIPEDMISLQPWLAERRERSITELEILHGVLNNPEMAGHAFFYFRDPSYVDNTPEDEDRADFVSQNETERQKLANLKERILRHGFIVSENESISERRMKDNGTGNKFPVRIDYPDPETLRNMIRRDFIELIDDLFPEDEIPDPLDRVAAEHEDFALSRAEVETSPGQFSGVYIGRKEYFERLDKHVENKEPPLTLIGESGAGKSALLANWALKYRESHSDDFLLMHFIAGTPYSADWEVILRRIMGEFKRNFAIKQDIPEKASDLRSAFGNWLSMAAARAEKDNRRIIIILDALNQLEDRDQAPDLVWMPPSPPGNVRFLLSTLPGRSLDEIRRRGWPVMKVDPLTEKERLELIPKYLAQYAKSLSEDRIRRIASAPQSANPLYLRALLEELRLFGIHEKLEQRIQHYLQAATISGLYTKILERWEQDYQGERPGLVRDSMSLLWGARRGLTQSELLHVLGKDSEPLPMAVWSPLRYAADAALINRSGLIGFAHNFIREAIESRYLKKVENRNAVHLKLADYFEQEPQSPRSIDELPWQLSEAAAWKRLYTLLSSLSFFNAAWKMNQYEVRTFWSKLEANSIYSMMEGYKPVIEAPDRYEENLTNLAFLLDDSGHPMEAMKIHESLVVRYKKNKDLENLQGSLCNQANILYAQGRLDSAMSLYRKQERICRELGKKNELGISLEGQALILSTRGEWESAIKLHKERARFCRETGDRDGFATSLVNIVSILYKQGQYDTAMKLCKEVERIFRQLGNKDGLLLNLGNQGSIHATQGNLESALKLYGEEEKLCRELGDKVNLSTSLGNQASIFYIRGELDKSLNLYRQQEEIYRETGRKEYLAASLGNQGLIMKDLGKLDAAIKLHKEEENICKELGNEYGLQRSIGNQGGIFYQLGDYNSAMNHFKEQERICRELGNKNGVSLSLGNQALILSEYGKFDEAMKLRKQEEKLCREMGNLNGLQKSLGNQGSIMHDQGDLESAMKLYKQQEQICRKLRNKRSLLKNVGNQAMILHKLDKLNDALKMFEEQGEISRELKDTKIFLSSLINQASLLALGMNHVEEGLSRAEMAYRLASQYGIEVAVNQIRPILEQIRARKREGSGF
mgnify:CR=1 FL=1